MVKITTCTIAPLLSKPVAPERGNKKIRGWPLSCAVHILSTPHQQRRLDRLPPLPEDGSVPTTALPLCPPQSSTFASPGPSLESCYVLCNSTKIKNESYVFFVRSFCGELGSSSHRQGSKLFRQQQINVSVQHDKKLLTSMSFTNLLCVFF
jgi:hypothetical protein